MSNAVAEYETGTLNQPQRNKIKIAKKSNTNPELARANQVPSKKERHEHSTPAMGLLRIREPLRPRGLTPQDHMASTTHTPSRRWWVSPHRRTRP